MSDTPSLDLYTKTCGSAAGRVISAYSTSFGAAVTLLGARHRHHVRNIYALVRVADELVDGVASEAGLSPEQQRDMLDSLEAQTREAIALGYSTNPVIHAFALTAAECGIDDEIIAPFFQSMRTDITAENVGADTLHTFSEDEHASYVYGSAEVIGLMCMRVFTRGIDYSMADQATLVNGARSLGAAFQNINFLRDLADDSARLGRDYLGANQRLTEAERNEWIRTIRTQLQTARDTLPLLPKDARRAVRCALDFFAALTRKLSRTPAQDLYRKRVRIPNPVKFVLLAQASTRTALERA